MLVLKSKVSHIVLPCLVVLSSYYNLQTESRLISVFLNASHEQCLHKYEVTLDLSLNDCFQLVRKFI